MLSKIDVMCLAKSQKHGGRCIAFLRRDGRGWVRPVKTDGRLSVDDCVLDTGKEIQVFDVARIQLIEHRPEAHQPENWLVADGPWEFLAHSFTSRDYSILAAALVKGPDLLGNQSDKLLYRNLIVNKKIHSLGLITARNVDIEVGTDIMGRPQIRVVFEFCDVEYGLVVTDVDVKNKLEGVDKGIYSGDVLGFHPDEKLLLTISVGQKFGPFCYKIVPSLQKLTGSKVDLNRLNKAIEQKLKGERK